MTSPSNAASRPTTTPNYPSSKTSRSFFVGLLAIALVLLTAGIGAFWYLTAGSPIASRSDGDRPIAVATAFVPADAPFAFSLLANPDELIARQQALLDTDPQAVLEAAQQIEQSLFKNSLIDYDRDIRPWLGGEVTVACTELDLDFDETNGEQLGYLLALEIAPGRSQQAKESLQLFWQRQSLAGDLPTSEQLNGVRVLSAAARSRDAGVKNSRLDPARLGLLRAGQAQQMGAASALVGNQFVLFANDARVIRRSLRATETAANLAQNRAYRTAADKLPNERLGLAYLNTVFLNELDSEQPAPPSFATVSLELADTGIVATAQLPESTNRESVLRKGALNNRSVQSVERSPALFRFVPADSAIAFTSQNLSQLEPAVAASGFSLTLPDFLKLSLPNTRNSILETEQSPWQWAKGEYAIAQTQSGKDDWILVVKRTADGVTQIDEFAKSQGYSATPLTLEGQDAIAWTKLKTRAQRRQASSTLETEVLGLHLQPNDLQNDDALNGDAQNGYEIFASSVAAMDDALGASARSLLSDPRFVQVGERDDNAPEIGQAGYLYMDRSAILSAIAQRSALKNIESALRPITRQIDGLTANKSGSKLNLFVRFEPSQSELRDRP